jgi:hypothetical protein
VKARRSSSATGTERPKTRSARVGEDRWLLASLLAMIGVCCGTTILVVAGGAGLLSGAAGWLAGGGWLAIPIALAAAVAVIRLVEGPAGPR